MLVVNSEGPETRVGVIEEGALAEFFVERKRDRGMVGNIYRGKVTRVLPGMQAAFVDLGPKVERRRSSTSPTSSVAIPESCSRTARPKTAAMNRPKARPRGSRARASSSRSQDRGSDQARTERAVSGHQRSDRPQGARVTGYLSLPGRYSVFMPHVPQIGVSKRIGSDKERRRLRDIVNEARPKGTGFIVRTAAEDANDQEMRDDVDFLARLWGEIEKREETMHGPGLVYADFDLALRCVRDLMRRTPARS